MKKEVRTTGKWGGDEGVAEKYVVIYQMICLSRHAFTQLYIGNVMLATEHSVAT